MKNLQKFTLLILCSFLGGCASVPQSTHDYRAPTTKYATINEMKVEQPFDEVWDKFVKNLATSFFAINNIEKASRIINVSFSTDNPERYVDCGETSRSFTKGGSTEFYRYEVASHSTYKSGGTWGPYNNLPLIFTVSRRPSLEGRANIYIAPDDKGTITTVNVRYSISLNADAYAQRENMYGTEVVR